MLEFGISVEAEMQPDIVDLDLDWESLSSAKQRRLKAIFPGVKKKTTYRANDRTLLVQNPDWKAIAMTLFNFEDNPFRQIREEIDQLQGQYSKLEYVTKGVSKILGDCRLGKIYKELKKLQQKDMETLEATNAMLTLRVADLRVELAKKDKEIR